MKLRSVADLDLIDTVLLVLAISYFVALIARPSLYADFDPIISAVFLSLFGIMLTVSVFLNISAIYFVMSIGYIYGFIISWTGFLTWNVSYDPGMAAASMALIDFFIASLLMYKAIRTSTLAASIRYTRSEQETMR